MPLKRGNRRKAQDRKENIATVSDGVRGVVEGIDREGMIRSQLEPELVLLFWRDRSLTASHAVEENAVRLLARAEDMRQALRCVFQTKLLTLPKAVSRQLPSKSPLVLACLKREPNMTL